MKFPTLLCSLILEALLLSNPGAAFEVPAGQPVLDWRNVRGQNWTSPLKYQGACGSCAAFAINSTIEAKRRIQLELPWLDTSLSEEAVYACGYGAQTPSVSCEIGLYFDRAMISVMKEGIPDEACFPNTIGTTGKAPSCAKRCADRAETSFEIAGFSDTGNGDHFDPESLKLLVEARERYLHQRFLLSPMESRVFACRDPESDCNVESYLYAYYVVSKEWLREGPIVRQFDLNSDLYSYRGGVYRTSENGGSLGTHFAAIVGYDDQKEAWLVQNSWGPNWGEKGFGYLAYDDSIFWSMSYSVGTINLKKESSGAASFVDWKNSAVLQGEFKGELRATSPTGNFSFRLTKARVPQTDLAPLVLRPENCAQSAQCQFTLDTLSLSDGEYVMTATWTPAPGSTEKKAVLRKRFFVANRASIKRISLTADQGFDRVQVKFATNKGPVPPAWVEGVVTDSEGTPRITVRVPVAVSKGQFAMNLQSLPRPFRGKLHVRTPARPGDETGFVESAPVELIRN